MKVAFATQDNVHINAHFGWAKKVDIYDVSSEGYEFLNTVEFGGDLKEDGNEDKLIPKIKAVSGCQIVYVSAIGSSAASSLLKHNVTALKVENQDNRITDVLNSLVETLDSPPPWLRKALGKRSHTFDFDDEQL
jgi:nitrogen fixation protein NifX